VLPGAAKPARHLSTLAGRKYSIEFVFHPTPETRETHGRLWTNSKVSSTLRAANTAPDLEVARCRVAEKTISSGRLIRNPQQIWRAVVCFSYALNTAPYLAVLGNGNRYDGRRRKAWVFISRK
jgi:hypothetical protein